MAQHADAVRRTLRVTGQVQGVGFRPFVYRLARSLDLGGSVRNDAAGVVVEVQGHAGTLADFEARVFEEAPQLARVEAVQRLGEAEPRPGPEPFRILESDGTEETRGRVTVDSATCEDCLLEILDPANRRHRHALVNCTNCGPRYTIVRDLPYDRPLTTMASFPMCPACEREYRDPADRRFHAQPTCCPGCGPRLRLLSAEGAEFDGDPIRRAQELLSRGGVLAVKGLGGHHLVCDAADEAAVARLRRGKRRDHKPFALMAADLEAADGLVVLSEAARCELASPARPIVLAPRVSGAPVAASVAPGVHRLGVMLPYTPLQHLLFAEGLGPLVTTSANVSDDPLIKDDTEVVRRLGPLCDAFLVHDRPIERAVDDSVVLDAPRGPVVLRRARGHVPAPIRLPVTAPLPGLCVGADLKNVVAVVRGDEAVLGQHVGDLEYTLARHRFERTIDDLRRLYGVDVRWIACDAHPDYASHRWAERAAGAWGVPLLRVYHHHAHLASVLAEHGRRERTIGLVCDGVGYGTDGTAWGGEVLVGDLEGFRRAGRLRPLRLPGGDAAARETGRCALAWLHDALGADAGTHAAATTAMPDEARRAAVVGLLARGVNCPSSSGLGRLFDAAAALLGVCSYNHHEAMSGMRLEARAADARGHLRGDGLVPLRRDTEADLLELDHRPLLAALLDVLAGENPPIEEAAFLFHDAIADALARAAVDVAAESGVRTVALSGGVFANALLTDLVATRLAAADLDVLLHGRVPPNDGGIALGQGAVAAARLRLRDPEMPCGASHPP